MQHTFYGDENDSWIPDVTLLKVEGDSSERKVWFLWRAESQWLEMTTEHDGDWLITETEYTEDFEQWLEDHLDEYDSLEMMFSSGLVDVIPETYEIEFEVAN